MCNVKRSRCVGAKAAPLIPHYLVSQGGRKEGRGRDVRVGVFLKDVEKMEMDICGQLDLKKGRSVAIHYEISGLT